MTVAQRRRGLSPIVSVILLILVAVGATIILYTWLSSAASNNPTHTGELYERVVINAVQYNNTANTATIYVTNLGKVSVKIASAYILDAVNGQAVCSNTSANVPIGVGKTGNVTITSCSLGKGVYIAKIVTSDGVSATYTFTR
ncbi:MAG: hypothetical protein GSR80_000236 [Desulfurococcales archaeon]|nr:hypothetical protein [Desulfurococcales archaeon]